MNGGKTQKKKKKSEKKHNLGVIFFKDNNKIKDGTSFLVSHVL